MINTKKQNGVNYYESSKVKIQTFAFKNSTPYAFKENQININNEKTCGACILENKELENEDMCNFDAGNLFF